MEAAAAIL